MPLSRVRLIPAGHDRIYGNVAMFVSGLPVHPSEARRESATVRGGQWVVAKIARELGITVTGGSSSVVDAWGVLRLAAATARAQLLGAASLDLEAAGERARRSRTASSAIRAAPAAHYGELAKTAAATPSGTVRLKPPSEWKLIGSAAPRHRRRRQERRHGAVRHGRAAAGPAVRGDPPLPDDRRQRRRGRRRGDAEAARRRARRPARLLCRLDRGARGRRPDAAGMRAQGADALAVEWRQRPAGGLDSAAILAGLEQRAREADANDGGFVFYSLGKVPAGRRCARSANRDAGLSRALPGARGAGADQLHRPGRRRQGRGLGADAGAGPGARHRRPRSPACRSTPSPSTSPISAAASVAASTSTSSARRCASRSNAAAGRCSWCGRARKTSATTSIGRPAVAVLRATLGEDGRPSSLRDHQRRRRDHAALDRARPAAASPARSTRPTRPRARACSTRSTRFANQRIAHVATQSGVPVGYWRSVGHSHNAFFSESFIDELAHAAGQDPVAYRLALLKDSPRHRAVLLLAAAAGRLAGLRRRAQPLAPGRARGVALHESFGGIVAAGGRGVDRRAACRACTGSSAPPTSASSSTRASSPSSSRAR